MARVFDRAHNESTLVTPTNRAWVPRGAPITGVAWVLSVVVHVGLASVVVWLAVSNWKREAEQDEADARARQGSGELEIDLPGVADGVVTADETRDPLGDPPVPRGGAAIARTDDGYTGKGGDETAAIKAIHLTDRDEAMRLSPDLVSRFDRDQQQRIKSGTVRMSWEDRRATTHPMELTFIASGKGERQERRELAKTDPSRGAMESTFASTLGGSLGDLPAFAGDLGEAPPTPDGVTTADARSGSKLEGATLSSPGLGAHGAAAGVDHRASAAVALARPDVTLGPIAVPAIDKARPKDDVDSEQEVSTIVRSLVHASAAGGATGDGRGGTGGGGATSSGATSGEGSHARPLGTGDGDLFDLDTSDPRLLPYFRRLHAKLDPLWANAFPRSAMLELKQGTVILEFTIEQSGAAHVHWPPLRPSGIDEFDRNCADAIRRASPFDPIPASLGVKQLRVRAPFDAKSPIVD